MPASTAYIASRIFTGESWLTDHALVTENGMISAVVPVSSLRADQAVRQFDSGFIAPAFIDLQIYGANGKLLGAYPEADSIFQLENHCEKGGTVFFLPTVATNSLEIIHACIDAVKEYWKQGGKAALGLHLEGPWINPARRGAHIGSMIHPPTKKEAAGLLKYGKGVIRMITLAPEICSPDVMDLLVAAGIILSAGHSDATYEQAGTGFARGISAVTHLYNAMSPLHHRQPGLVGAAMDDPRVVASIIPDGFHVDYAAIRIAKQVMKDRLFAITDAVTDTIDGPYRHSAAGNKFEAGGILSGSALSMNKALQNLVNFAGIELGEALRMCSLYPARLLGMDQDFGKIEAGSRTRMLLLDDELEIKQLL